MLSKLCCLSTESCKGQCLGLTRNQNIKLAYLVILMLVLLFSYISNDVNRDLHPSDQKVQQFQCTEVQPQFQSQCIAQKQTTLNFLALTIMHFVLFLSLLPKNKHVKVINEGLWIIKFMFIAGLIFLYVYTFGPSISSVASFLSVILSPILFIITNIIVIDNIYFLDFKINALCEKYNKLHLIKVGLSVVFWVMAIVLNVFSYYHNELWICVSTSVLIGVFLVLTFLRLSKNNSLFVYSLAVLHLTLITYSVHPQHPNRDDPLLNLQHPYRIFIMMVTLFCMLSQGGNQIRTKNSTFNEILALNTSKREQDNRYVSSNKWIIYHLLMVFIVFSLPVVLGYDLQATDLSSRSFIDIGKITWWVSAVLIYFWSIMVQKMYPQQDFSELQNYFKEFQLN